MSKNVECAINILAEQEKINTEYQILSEQFNILRNVMSDKEKAELMERCM